MTPFSNPFAVHSALELSDYWHPPLNGSQYFTMSSGIFTENLSLSALPPDFQVFSWKLSHHPKSQVGNQATSLIALSLLTDLLAILSTNTPKTKLLTFSVVGPNKS